MSHKMSLRNKIMVFVMMASGFIGSLSQNLLTSALPSIMHSMNVSAEIGQWLTTSYIMVMGVITAITAYLFYRFNTKRLLMISISIFVAGCVLALFAPNFQILLIARIIQACGAGPTIPLLQTALIYVFPPDRQGQALGLTGIIVGFAPAIGPTLSGLLVDAWGWRSIFIFLILAGVFVIILGQFTLSDIGERKELPLDILSIILYSIGFSSFMLAVTYMKNGGFLQFNVIALFTVGISTLWVFVKRQLSQEAPLLKLRLLRHKTLILGIIILASAYALNMAGTILIPLYNQTICNYTATISGLIMLPGSLIIAIISPVSGRLMDNFGAKIICIIGTLMMISGNIMFVFLGDNPRISLIVIAYALRCLGMTFLMTPSTALAIQDIPLIDKPYGMAILNSLRQMSGSLFSTILVILAAATSLGSTLDIRGIHVSFVAMTGIAVVGLVISFVIPQGKKSTVTSIIKFPIEKRR